MHSESRSVCCLSEGKEVAWGLGLQRPPVNKTVADKGDNAPSKILMRIFSITIKDFNTRALSPGTACRQGSRREGQTD